MPRRSATLLAAAAALSLAAVPGATASVPARAPAPPHAVDLDGAAWQYAPDPGDRGKRRHWAEGRGRPAWEPVRLPHVFDANADPSTFRGQVGWYRLRLYQPRDTPRGFAWGAHFEQVRRVADVYLDGRRIARHRDPYAPFTVPLPALRDGRRHELLLRVDNRKGREPREGWWNWGGITRPAKLVPLGALTTGAPGFLPQRTCDAEGADCHWSVLVDAVVTNRARGTLRPTLVARLTAPAADGRAGAPAGTATAKVRSLTHGERARVRFRVPVTGEPSLWQPGHPALYGITLETRAGAALQQVDAARVGLRTVAVRDGLLELNGQPVQLRGASIQEDVAGHGAALTDADIDGIVRRLQQLGANVTRAHYALDERLARRLDEAGVLVWTQAPIYHRDRLLRTAAQRAQALDTVRATVLATRSHPSTLTHSVANELSTIPDTVPGTAAFLRDARQLTRDVDPTLPVSVDTLSYPGYAAQRAYAAFDLLGINSYFGWYPGKPNHSTADIERLGPYLDQMHAMYPGLGLVVTEFGAEATRNGPATEKETYAFQAAYARSVLDTIGGRPAISGAIYWTLQEFAVKPRWEGGVHRADVPRDSIHHKGLIAYAGQRKPAWAVVRDDAARTPLFRPEGAIASALGTRAPQREAKAIALIGALAILAALAMFLALDAWALLGWRAATNAELEDAQRVAAGDTDADGRPRLRLIA